jgi:23S rRNA pseudouridine1911/1915/1917 synthase
VIIHFTADRGDAHLRLDQMLVRRVTDVSRMSRTRAQSWIVNGRVSIDGVPAARASSRVREGATVEIALPAATARREEPRAEDLVLDIIYEDDDILAVNKPPGMVVHPSFRNPSGTVLNGVLWRLRHRPNVRPGLVTRLDKDTSGLVLIALSSGVHSRVQRDAKAGRVRKEYVAIVRGTPQPPQGTIALPLGHDPGDRRRIVVSENGMPSETRYRVASSGAEYSLVECELVTGRTHQIRVHLAALGSPVAGDGVYGSPDAAILRQALHARRLTLPHPVTHEPLRLEAPFPEDFRTLMAALTPGGSGQP